MTLNRRVVLTSAVTAAAVAALPRWAKAAPSFVPAMGDWRTFETTIRIDVLKPEGKVQAWIPVPAVDEPDWMRLGENSWKAEDADAVIEREPKYGARMLHVTWKEGVRTPSVEVKSRVSARDRRVDLAAPGSAKPLTAAERALYTEGTSMIPIDGIVKETADKITAGGGSDLDKARTLYHWVVDHTFRNPKTRGCGVGDISFMLRSGDLSGKCADINALYVGLARAAGLPARDVYGLRLTASRYGYKSLGPATEVVTKAQHCRAEVFIDGYGWTPVDPGDVRKVILEEPPGNLAPDDPAVTRARNTLFGAWEGNWLAYNVAHDVTLPGSSQLAQPFLMYPEAETAAGRLDCLDPDNVRYAITVREAQA